MWFVPELIVPDFYLTNIDAALVFDSARFCFPFKTRRLRRNSFWYLISKPFFRDTFMWK